MSKIMKFIKKHDEILLTWFNSIAVLIAIAVFSYERYYDVCLVGGCA